VCGGAAAEIDGEASALPNSYTLRVVGDR